jgi:hypothetical protein
MHDTESNPPNKNHMVKHLRQQNVRDSGTREERGKREGFLAETFQIHFFPPETDSDDCDRSSARIFETPSLERCQSYEAACDDL